jgi:hypothetical protein
MTNLNTNTAKKQFINFFKNIHESVKSLNSSKIFAGLMIITLNISSRFVTIKLSKSMESYLKYTFSKQILIFAIAWMGTRDIYIALLIVLLYTLFFEYLFNEDSSLCILSENFTSYHQELVENDKVTDEELMKAQEVIKKAEKQNEVEDGNKIVSFDTSTWQ